MARKERHIHYIYKTTCNVTGRWYIGMHSAYNIEDGYMGSGKRLRRSIRKYGVENHTKEILELFESRELLIEAEKNAITLEILDDDMCMNLKPGGTGGWSTHIDDKIKKYIISRLNECRLLKLVNDDDFKKHLLNKQKEGILNTYKNGRIPNVSGCDWNGKNHSEETKRLMSESKKGKGLRETNSQYGTCWITKDGLNKKIKKEEIEIWLNEGWEKGRK